MGGDWDPERYLLYADERERPFAELLGRIPEIPARRVIDLGCGPGSATLTLTRRWPDAEVIGLDSSPAMIARAERDSPGPDYRVGDLREWAVGAEQADVVISNATLQWVPGHRDLWGALVASVRPGGVLAFGVPGNFDQPSHTLLEEVAELEPFRLATRGVPRPRAFAAAVYLADLAALGCVVDAWETTYLHVLRGEDPVFAWTAATAARPMLDALGGEDRERFAEEYRRRLAGAYPVGEVVPGAVLMPFRRIFVVARVPG